MSAGKIRVGIGGWDFDPWRGTFYPNDLPKTRQLEYAAAHLTAIEINSTYYRGQKPATFAKWSKAAPECFKVAVKASRYATNRKILAEGSESIERFLNQGITELGDHLGPILWQFMATKRFDAEEFAAFLALLPNTQGGLKLHHALEVRHESFRDPAFYALARKANAAIVYADSDEFPCIEEATADFTYARLQKTQERLATGYSKADIAKWAATARDWTGDGRDAYVFMISGAKVRNPAAAQALMKRVSAGKAK